MGCESPIGTGAEGGLGKMVLAISVYLAAFGLVWGSLTSALVTYAHEPLWTMPALICPLAWIVGLALRLPRLLTAGLYGVVGLAVWATLSGAFPAGLGAVVLTLLAWDAAGLALWLRPARAEGAPSRGEIWWRFALRSSGLGAIGMAVAFGFAQMRLLLPLWGLVGLLLAAWGALAAFRRMAVHHRSSDGQVLNGD